MGKRRLRYSRLVRLTAAVCAHAATASRFELNLCVHNLHAIHGGPALRSGPIWMADVKTPELPAVGDLRHLRIAEPLEDRHERQPRNDQPALRRDRVIQADEHRRTLNSADPMTPRELYWGSLPDMDQF